MSKLEEHFRRIDALWRTPWEIKCNVCGRSSWDGKPDDEDGDRCPYCGQLPAKAEE